MPLDRKVDDRLADWLPPCALLGVKLLLLSAGKGVLFREAADDRDGDFVVDDFCLPQQY